MQVTRCQNSSIGFQGKDVRKILPDLERVDDLGRTIKRALVQGKEVIEEPCQKGVFDIYNGKALVRRVTGENLDSFLRTAVETGA